MCGAYEQACCDDDACRAICACRAAPLARTGTLVACSAWCRAALISNACASPRVPGSALLTRGSALTEVCCIWLRRPSGVTDGGNTASNDGRFLSSTGMQANGRTQSCDTATCPGGFFGSSGAQTSGNAGVVTLGSRYAGTAATRQPARSSFTVHANDHRSARRVCNSC